jgi:ATPase subunit of ABC transporter with duplicated ATPase domains
VLFDEPTNDLDQAAIQVLLDHVQALAKQITVVAITHDRGLQALPHQDLRLFHD